MFDLHRMAFINLVLSGLLLTGTIIYKYIFPKKKINFFVLLILISILPIVSIFRPGDYESGDFNIHIRNAMSFYNNLKDGQLIPSWGGDLNSSYGYPLFIFSYVLLYYFVSFLHIIGFSFIDSMKIFLGSCFILSGIVMFKFAFEEFKDKKAAFVAATFYLFSPYHLVNLHFRATGGEIAGFLFIPLLLYCFKKIIDKQSLLLSIWTGVILYLSYLAHSPSTVFAGLIILPYIYFKIWKNQNKIQIIKYLLLTATIGIILSMHAWIADILLLQFTNYHKSITSAIIFVPFWQLFYSPWRFGFLFQGPNGELSYVIGYTQLAVVTLSIIAILTNKVKLKYKTFIIFWLSLFSILLFLLTPISRPIWSIIPTLDLAQFSTRLLILVSFCTSMLAGYVSLIFSKKRAFITILVVLTIGYTIFNWGHRSDLQNITDSNLSQDIGNTYGASANESTKWVNQNNPWQNTIPTNHLEILNGNANIINLNRTSTKHTYIINAKSAVKLKENTLFFPGWKIYANQKEQKIIYTDKQFSGIMIFSLPKGLYFIEANYNDLTFHKYAKILTFILLAAIIFYSLFVYIKKKSLKLPKF